jgi:hypothetical protein
VRKKRATIFFFFFSFFQGQNLLIIILRRLLDLPAVAADSASLGFGVVSSVVCGVALTAVHNSPLQPFVFGFLALWFIAYAIVHAFATPGKPAAAAQQNPAKKKKE